MEFTKIGLGSLSTGGKSTSSPKYNTPTLVIEQTPDQPKKAYRFQTYNLDWEGNVSFLYDYVEDGRLFIANVGDESSLFKNGSFSNKRVHEFLNSNLGWINSKDSEVVCDLTKVENDAFSVYEVTLRKDAEDAVEENDSNEPEQENEQESTDNLQPVEENEDDLNW